jgi:hypothetical protein
MLRLASFLTLATLAVSALAGSGGRLTDKCRTSFETGVILEVTAEGQAAIVAEVNRGRLNHTDLFTRLWEPVRARTLEIPPNHRYVVLDFMQNQDLEQILADLRAEAVLASLGVTNTWPNSPGCFVTLPAPLTLTLTEFHNAKLDRYFLAPSLDWLARSVPQGPSGPEWKRTGEVGHTITPDFCYHAKPVFSFYNGTTQTQVLTEDPAECGALRRDPRRWSYRGEAFGVVAASGGQCNGYRAVWRLHDPRSPLSERLVWRPEVRAQMIARGWVDDGVAFCFNEYGR